MYIYSFKCSLMVCRHNLFNALLKIQIRNNGGQHKYSISEKKLYTGIYII